ncbi:phosphatidylserine decarboxylase family protein [candidate division GN15 bacterium]|nr:phosphatidylserine decarboxylase family protein [candidate division GN15 bacterium]
MIARDGWPIVIFAIALFSVVTALAVVWPATIVVLAAVVVGLLTALTIYFFRDPERSAPSGAGVLVAPADGKVVAIKGGEGHAFVAEDANRISIFLSIFDVHVNRVPVSGTVAFLNYIPGKFLAAFAEKASLENEQTEIGITTEDNQRVVFKQIAGLIARRIVCRIKTGDSVTTGARMGMIRFGSRVDVFLPPDADIAVNVGDRVVAGQTMLARLHSSSSKKQTAAGPADIQEHNGSV